MATYRIVLPSGPYKIYLPRIPDEKFGFLFLQQDYGVGAPYILENAGFGQHSLKYSRPIRSIIKRAVGCS
jgi:hypothetical protein